VTLAAGSQDVPIQADGTFSATFATSALAPFAPGYPITFTYAGDANFTAASASSLLVVTYGTNGLTLSSGPFNSGAAIPFRVTLLDASGTNVSSAALAVYAYGVQLVGTATWLPAPSTGNSGDDFQFQSGGFYTFRLKSTGLPAGSYVLGYAVANDPVIHTIPFTIK
jgi:hypothetical protein